MSVGLHSCWTPQLQQPVLDSSAALQNAASQNAALQRARMAGMAMAMRPRPEAGEVTYSMLHGRGGGRPNGLPRARPSSSPDRPTSPLLLVHRARVHHIHRSSRGRRSNVEVRRMRGRGQGSVVEQCRVGREF